MRTHGTTGDEGQYIGLFSGQFAEYILAIDLVTGRSFKLGGFNQNDLHGFLDAVSEAYESLISLNFPVNDFEELSCGRFTFQMSFAGTPPEETGYEKISLSAKG